MSVDLATIKRKPDENERPDYDRHGIASEKRNYHDGYAHSPKRHKLPLLVVPKELRRRKQEKESEAFRRFEAVRGHRMLKQVLAARRQADANPKANLDGEPNVVELLRRSADLLVAHRACAGRYGAEN